MVCGRLPFGDDSQVKSQQKNGLAFSSSRILSDDVKDLLRHILNPIVPNRYDSLDMLLHSWTASKPIEIPRSVSSKPKYTLENCLPATAQRMFNQPATSGESTASAAPVMPTQVTSTTVTDQEAMQTTPTHHPLVPRIGRRIADMVRPNNMVTSGNVPTKSNIYTNTTPQQ